MTSWPTERGDPSDDAHRASGAAGRELDAEVAERLTVERATTRWSDLLAGSVGTQVEVVSLDGACHRGGVAVAAADWCLLDVVEGRWVLVPIGQVLTASGLGRAATGGLTRAGMGWALRRWQQMRCNVAVHLVDGSVRGGEVTAVFADAFTVRHEQVGPAVTVPLTAVCWIGGDPFSD
jgi:hypothetical protein